jgi:hypothetical protein
MQLIQLSEATASLRRIFFQAVDAADGITAETGLTGAGRISKAGAATAASTNNITEIDATNMPGRYYIELTATEVNTLGIIEFRFKTAACAEVVARGLVVAFDPFTASNLGVTNLDATISSRATAAALATVDGIVDAILVDTDTTIPGLIAALNDLSAAQVNAEMVDVVATDVIADSVPADGSRPTMRQALLMIARFLMEKSVSGTTVTVKKEDGTTSSMTFTLDSGTSPTSITRAT